MKKLIKKTDSKSTLRTYTMNYQQATVYPDFNPLAVEEMINNDPVARGALIHFVDKVLDGDYTVVKKDTREYDQAFEDILVYDHNFDNEVLAKVARSGKLFNSAFLEIVKKTDNSLKSLNILDFYSIEPITAANGDIIEFRSKIVNPSTGKYPTWTKDEIIWFKFGDRTLGFPPMDLRALWENLLLKDFVKRFVSWLWKTGQYRVVYNFTGADKTVVDDFIAYNRKVDINYQEPILSRGDMKHTVLRDMKEMGDLTKILEYCDGQTLILMRVPPIDAGIPDASGRSNADAQSNNFITHVSSFKKAIAGTLNTQFFPKINKGNNLLIFGPADRFAEKQVIDNVNIMKNMGMKEELIREYMQDKGMFWGAAKIFEVLPKPILSSGTKPMTSVPGVGKKDINMMPSRFKGAGTPLDKKGTGKQSSTRVDQLIKKTFSEPTVLPKDSWVI